MNRFGAAALLALVACATTARRDADAPANADARKRAVEAANAEQLPVGRWGAAEVLALDGVVIERYKTDDGHTLIAAPDDWASARVIDVWRPLAFDAERLDRVVRGARRAEAELARVEGRAAQPRATRSGGWLLLGTIEPARVGCEQDLESAIDRALARWDRPVELGAGPVEAGAGRSVRARLEASLAELLVGPNARPTEAPLELLRRRLAPREATAAGPALLVAAGRFDRAVLLREVRRAIARRAAAGPPAGPGPAPLTTTSSQATAELWLPAERRFALVAWPLDRASAEAKAGAEAVVEWIGLEGGAFGASTVEAAVVSRRGRPALELLLALPPAASATAAVARAQARIDGLASAPLGEPMVERIRRRMRARRLNAIDEIGARALTLARAEIEGGVEALVAEREAIDRLDGPAIAAIVREWLAAKRRRSVTTKLSEREGSPEHKKPARSASGGAR